MEVTALTWVVAVLGLLIIGLLASLQLVAVLRPRSEWTIENVYGSSPEGTDPTVVEGTVADLWRSWGFEVRNDRKLFGDSGLFYIEVDVQDDGTAFSIAADTRCF